MNEVARDLSRELEVPLVDHGADFRARFREQGGYAALMYASDHHPNARGYALMVDAILARFRALNLIDWLPPPLEAPAPKLDQRVALSCDAAGELKLAAPVGFIFDVLLSTRRDPPIAFGGITLPIGIDEKISLKANDVPQLRGRVEREWTSITIPRELLDVPELYAAAVLFDDDAVVRAVSACIAVER
ncbi:MAG: SGNH/GDSL hydrolase family protein [Planctomycetota bacterium]